MLRKNINWKPYEFRHDWMDGKNPDEVAENLSQYLRGLMYNRLYYLCVKNDSRLANAYDDMMCDFLAFFPDVNKQEIEDRATADFLEDYPDDR